MPFADSSAAPPAPAPRNGRSIHRGVLRVGKAADLMLFDPATINRGDKQRVHDLPGGAPRLTTPAVGLHGVWVNGRRIVAEDGSLIAGDALPGKVLKRFAA